ncbi:beta-glucoside-specific PTS transporter subunit IIABC [Vagococcus fessus]|uniref:PTS beta-glucoside transporter subunit EIIBCA n=1 Tax=Vagococcus fessus TaxID=120370 RepID=A0A430ABU8_9ENTE|nr:beta-glucoside-specific PTS transporter subunit IIABC [Vagococcus fessus]RSU04618.1 PTS beta-glucoside transporter subunit EIIBCA [Vagococcus fessus]
MSKVKDYQKLANDILDILGKDNIVSATRCATRLRLVLKETPKDAKEKIAALIGVITVVENGGQFQIVIGNRVGEVYEKFNQLTGGVEGLDSVDVPKESVMNRIIATMSAVFAPFIYILAAAGILQGSLILINLGFPAFANTDTYQVLSMISWAPFTFLPIFIALTASKHFKTNTYIAVACSAALVSPSWAEMAAKIAGGESMNFLGLPLSETTYTSSVLPPLLMVWVLSYLERFVKKHLPEVVTQLFTPLICLVIMVPLTMLLIGPLSAAGATMIADGYNFLVEVAPPLAGAVIGGFWQVIVIFGVHWGITPVNLANYDLYGKDSFQAFQTIAVVAQVGATLAVFLKAKDKELKGVSLSAFITGIFGITEPAIYGVTLKYKKPFIYGCISGAIGAMVASFFNPYYYAYAGLPSLLTTVNGISSENPMSFIGIMIGCAIAIVGPILLVQLFGFGETVVVSENATFSNNVIDKNEVLISPMSGELVSLNTVPDEIFASGAMGNGFGIIPSGNKVFAPFDGVVTMEMPSGHAIGLLSDNGVEVLIHVGLDTVKLEGKPFKYHVEENAQVKRGDLLIEFDREAIEDAGLSLVTPVIVTNSESVSSFKIKEDGKIKLGEEAAALNLV